jgi:ABC-type multidrug transport system fused ATPase/permease subunit
MSVIIFPNLYSEFVSNFPDDVTNININKLILLFFPYFVSEIIFYLSDTIDSYAIPKIESSVINKLINDIILSVKTTKKEINTNELILNLKKIYDIREIYHLTCAYVLPAIAVSCGLTYFFMKSDVKFGLAVGIIIIFTFMYLIMVSNDCSNISQKTEKSINLFYDDVYDVVNNVEHIIGSRTEITEENRLHDNQKIVINNIVHKDNCNSNLKFTFAMICFCLMIVLDGFAVELYIEKKISKSVLITIFFMVALLIGLYNSMIYELSNITKNIGSYNEIERYFKQFEISDSNEKINELIITNGNIEFVNINLKIQDNVIFNNLNLKISPNSITGIMGNIGSGKSTLLKLLAGLIHHNSGSILIDNIDISQFDITSISKYISYIPQNSKLFNRTIYENLNYGSNYSEEQIKELIKYYNLDDFFKSFKDGLNTIVGKNGEKISGGQKQLIFILRAIFQNKKIYLFDEPTSSLDSYYKKILINLLSKNKNKTIMIVTHDNDLIKIFDNTINFPL